MLGLVYMLEFSGVFEKVASVGALHQSPPPPQSSTHADTPPPSTPDLGRIARVPYPFPPPFHLKYGAGPQEALAHKASTRVCHLTDSRKVGQLCVGGLGKDRAEQIKAREGRQGRLLNRGPFQSSRAEPL